MLAPIPPPFSALTSLWNLFPLVYDTHRHLLGHMPTHTPAHWRTRSVDHTHTYTYTCTRTHRCCSDLCTFYGGTRTKRKYIHTDHRAAVTDWSRRASLSRERKGKERSVCSVIKGIAARGERRKLRGKGERADREAKGQLCCATFRPRAKSTRESD